MIEEKWHRIYKEMEALIKNALQEAGKSEAELPFLMNEVKNILFN